jgi:hypothetical protein
MTGTQVERKHGTNALIASIRLSHGETNRYIHDEVDESKDWCQ